VRATAVEAGLAGKTADETTFREVAPLVLRSIDPIADFRGSTEYKRKMAVVHVGRALTQAASRASGPAENR
jgi:CO/xanthine dehydrogenase FAD-binding subunit